MPGTNEDWIQWSRYVLEGIKSLDKRYEHLESLVSKLSSDMEVLKREMALKSGVWGLLAGAIPVGVLLLIKAVG